VVSKAEVAAGKKRERWGSHGGRRTAGMRGWQGQPRKMVEYEHWQKTSQNVDRRAVGCNLVVLKMTCSQSGCKVDVRQ
jgi:hypothetical protein